MIEFSEAGQVGLKSVLDLYLGIATALDNIDMDWNKLAKA